MDEMKGFTKKINPDHTLLVIDSTIGQQSEAQSKAFAEVSSIGGIISLSGRIYSENFNNVDRIKCPVLIVHGEEDDVIKPHRFYETCDILIKSGYIIEKHLIKKMGHTINEEVIEIVSNFLKSYQ